MEVPNLEGNRLCFGKSYNKHSEQGQIRALVSRMYDILNGFYLDIGIAHISTSETEMAKANPEHLKVLGIRCPILVIFDRGYPAMEFIDFLEEAESMIYSVFHQMIIKKNVMICNRLTRQ